MEIFTFLYYANEESDDVIGGLTETVQHSITNISRNIKAVFFKLISFEILPWLSNCETFSGPWSNGPLENKVMTFQVFHDLCEYCKPIRAS